MQFSFTEFSFFCLSYGIHDRYVRLNVWEQPAPKITNGSGLQTLLLLQRSTISYKAVTYYVNTVNEKYRYLRIALNLNELMK